MGISTRPAVASDEEFVNALTREAMRPYVEATWPSDEEREEYYWLNRFQQNETEIIQVDGEDAGRITITRRPGCIVLEEIHIAPRFQVRGIGQMLIRKVLAEADERRIPTELKVLVTLCKISSFSKRSTGSSRSTSGSHPQVSRREAHPIPRALARPGRGFRILGSAS